MDCIQITEKKTGVKQKKEKKSYPHKKRVSAQEKRKNPKPRKKENRQFSNTQTFFLLCLRGQFVVAVTHQSTAAAVAVNVRWSLVVDLSRASSVGLLPSRSRTSCASPAPAPPFIALETVADRAAEEEKLGYGWLRSAQPQSRTFFKIKNLLFRHDRHGYGGRHKQPATPPLFGDIFPKFRDAIPPQRRHGGLLITLINRH